MNRVFLVLLLLLVPMQVQAGSTVYLCNGVYSNRPCTNGIKGQQKHLPSLSRYHSRATSRGAGSSSQRASLDPFKLDRKEKSAIQERDLLPPPSPPEEPNTAAGEGGPGTFIASGPEINEFLARMKGEIPASPSESQMVR